ncbi:hypothetical protein DUI87_11280 [Hirundo rustica rustica]|uniref:Uncharacterized protein n=1 Tax=Hirundo rustica rustica TaxID=333673 RepID=A0A3M0KGF9_HIRRU|nr:hypothetical protein DUI87_11280 [Hirundo rustica rustica]
MSGVNGKPPKLLGPTGVSHIPEESPDGEANSYLLGLREGSRDLQKNNASLRPAKEDPHVSSSPGISRRQSPKQLHAAAKEWPGCLRAIAAVAVNIMQVHPRPEDDRASIPVSAVLKVKGGHWLSPQRFLKYQDVEIVVTNIVNPASFLSMSVGEPVIHDCLEAIEATYSSCPDLKDTLPENTETWSTDGSSYVISGRHAGHSTLTHARNHSSITDPVGVVFECRIIDYDYPNPQSIGYNPRISVEIELCPILSFSNVQGQPNSFEFSKSA